MDRSDNFSGPWDMPLKRKHFDNHYNVKITIYDQNDNELTDYGKVIDYGEYEDRKFLGRITHWAMENNYIVETMRVEKN
jgi:hypothetical protein